MTLPSVLPRPALARSVATIAHRGQTYGHYHQPYTKHLVETVAVLARYGHDDEDLVCAAWLHDVLEDTDTKPGVLGAVFGPRVLELVLAATGIGKDRAARQSSILTSVPEVQGAVLVKLADRIANLEECRAELADRGSSRMLEVYRAEHPTFSTVLMRAKPLDSMMWAYAACLAT